MAARVVVAALGRAAAARRVCAPSAAALTRAAAPPACARALAPPPWWLQRRWMAGHSQWSNRKHQKGRADQQKSKLFNRLSRDIVLACRLGGGTDPVANARLATAIHAAKQADMPKSKIEDAIKMASNPAAGETIVFETCGPGGAHIIIEAQSPNKQHAQHEVRSVLKHFNAILGKAGTATFAFDQKGVVEVHRFPHDGEEASTAAAVDPHEVAILVEAEDVLEDSDDDGERDPDCFRLVCSPTDLKAVQTRVEEQGLQVMYTGMEYLPNMTVEVNEAQADELYQMCEQLENLDSVVKVITNAV